MSLILLRAFLFLFTIMVSSVRSKHADYDVVPRQRPGLQMQSRDLLSSPQPKLMSFDGNLDDIVSKALAAAQQNVDNSFACEGYGTVQHLEVVFWKYTIETVPTAVSSTVFGEAQEIALESTAPKTLACRSSEIGAASVVAMDTAIPSAKETNESCQPVLDQNNDCTVVEGRMRLFLNNKDKVDEATALFLANVQESYESPGFASQVGSGLLKITYLGDGNSDTSQNPIVSDNDKPGLNNNDIGVIDAPLTSLVFIAVGSAALVVFVGSVYLWRRGNQSDDEGAATQLAGNTTVMESVTRPRSPYSEMVASSFRGLGENMSILSNGNMSPVYEQDHEDTESSLNASGSGYGTTNTAGSIMGMDSGDSVSQYSKFSQGGDTPNCLGVRPLPDSVGGGMENASDSDLSDNELTPVKMFQGQQNSNLLLPSGDEEKDEERADHSLLFSPSSSDPEPTMEDISLASP